MTLEEAIREALRDGTLPCAVAFKVARAQNVSTQELGDMATALDIRVSHCQLGLFGYGPKEQGLHKVLVPAETVSEKLEQALLGRATNGRIACTDVWVIAKKMGIPKMEAAAGMEALGLKLTDCQLNCF